MQLPLFVESFPVDYEVLERCLRAPVIAVDVETETRWSGVGPSNQFGLSYPADTVIIALAWREGEGIRTASIIAPFEEGVRQFVRQLLTGEAVIVAHNAVFDLRQLSKFSENRVPDRIWDTMVMARLLHPEVRMSYRLLDVADALSIPYTERQREMKDWRGKLHELPRQTAAAYAEEDARLALAIYEKQITLPADPELVDWECRALREYCRMAAVGISLNLPYIEKRRAELLAFKTNAAERLAQDGLLEPDSPKARVRYLYQTKGIPLPEWDPDTPGYFTWGGYRRLKRSDRPVVMLDDLSTRQHVIESYLEENSPYADRLKDLAAYTRADWLVSMLESLVEHACIDGRVHSLITIATDTGRRASSHPAMQNWKMPDMAGVAVGDDGFTLVEIDYSNAENVMAALISGDHSLAAACATEDFHSAMATRYFPDAWDQADPAARRRLRGMSKRISYGTAYGMGAKSLGKSLGVSTEEAQALLRAKDAAFPNLARAKQLAEQKVRATARLKLWSGRPVAVESPFVAWNYICQGGVGEMLKRAIVQISEQYAARGLRSRVALDIHDALIIEVAHEEWDMALDLASGAMRTIIPEKLRARTNPPVEWIARPHLEENIRKWGKGQWHPPANPQT
jgi:DNA polymerase-1